MTSKRIKDFVESQKSLQFYDNIKAALEEVLSKLSEQQFEIIRQYLIIMAFHDGINGQVMHFEPRREKFSVMQLYIPKEMPIDVLKWVVAHELGHVMQKRNWTDGESVDLEEDATDFAEKIGYIKTNKISKWLADELQDN